MTHGQTRARPSLPRYSPEVAPHTTRNRSCGDGPHGETNRNVRKLVEKNTTGVGKKMRQRPAYAKLPPATPYITAKGWEGVGAWAHGGVCSCNYLQRRYAPTRPSAHQNFRTLSHLCADTRIQSRPETVPNHSSNGRRVGSSGGPPSMGTAPPGATKIPTRRKSRLPPLRRLISEMAVQLDFVPFPVHLWARSALSGAGVAPVWRKVGLLVAKSC